MASLNKVTLIGNLGKDPEIRTFQSGGRVASFSVATTEHWKTKEGEKKSSTEWHKVSVFNENLIKFIEQYLKKGSQVYVEGKIETKKFTDKNGVEKYSTEVVLKPFNGQIVNLSKLEKANDTEENSGDDLNDEIPF